MDVVSEDPISPPPSWSVIEFSFSNLDTDSELVVMCNYRQFMISLSADSFSESSALKSKYMFFLEVAENYELDGYTINDIYDWIVEPLLPIFKELPEMNTSLSLQTFLFPETYTYNLRADGDRVVAVLYDGSGNVAPLFGLHLPDDSCAPWPQYDPKDIQLPKEKSSPGPPSYTPSKVFLNDGQIAFLKLTRRGDERSFVNELGKYKSIRDAHLDQSLRISRLLGLVRNESGLVFGLLLTYVDCSRRTLLCAAKPDTPRDLRQSWAQQVHDIIGQLHSNGIIWGDAKPDNVLVDYKNDVWLIDFGGGYTNGWVPKELAGSVEGDLQALKKIDEFLEV